MAELAAPVVIAVIFEILGEFILTFVFEIVLEAGHWLFRGAFRRGWRSFVQLLFVGASFGGGLWWGTYVAGTGQSSVPLAFISLTGAASIAAVAALMTRPVDESEAPHPQRDERSLVDQMFSFDRSRWLGFALLNAAGAVGVGVGFFA